jgi:hypothetical protein
MQGRRQLLKTLFCFAQGRLFLWSWNNSPPKFVFVPATVGVRVSSVSVAKWARLRSPVLAPISRKHQFVVQLSAAQ